jgi:hypothetical protein
MAAEWALPAQPYTAYDGTNSVEICNQIETYYSTASTSASEESGLVTIDVTFPDAPPTQIVMAEGDRISVPVGLLAVTHTEWDERYVKVAP